MCKLLGWDLGAVAYKAAIYSYMIYENSTNKYIYFFKSLVYYNEKLPRQ